jgi:hypothetical protein
MTEYRRYQDAYGPLFADVVAVAGTQNYNGVLVPRDANHTIYVQRIVGAITTHSDGKSWTFQDTAGTPVPIHTYGDEVVADVIQPGLSVDFGPRGTPLTQGASLDIRGSAAGLAGRIHIEAYQKLTGVGVPA